MFTNKTGAPICADQEGNIVPCDSPQVAQVAVGAGSTITAEEAKRWKGLPEGDDNAPAPEPVIDAEPEPEEPAKGLTVVKQEAAPPENKMEAATPPASKAKTK